MLLPGILSGRQAIGWLRSTQYLANCRSTPSFNLGRVGVLYSLPSPIARCYATDRPVSRPKAHTGRSTSTRKPKAPAAPKKATKTAAKKVTKTVKKPAAKKTVKKPKAKTKTKAKPKTKKRVRKVLTEKQKAEVVTKKKRSDLQALKELALKPPHSKPATAYLVFHQEHSKGQSGLVSTLTKAAAMGYRNLSTERREHYNHIANQNKAANAIHFRQWIESHTPEVIHKANNARLALRRRGERRTSQLQDDREVKRPRSAYIRFSVERRASGDFAGIGLLEASKRIAQEWKALSAEQKRVYLEGAKQDFAKYAQEIKTVYNRDLRQRKTTA